MMVFPSSDAPAPDRGEYHGCSAPDENGVLQAAKGALPPMLPPAHHQAPVRLDSVQTVTTAADEEALERICDALPDPPLLSVQRGESSLAHGASFGDASLAARVTKAQHRN